jgi:hypothetical protein
VRRPIALWLSATAAVASAAPPPGEVARLRREVRWRSAHYLDTSLGITMMLTGRGGGDMYRACVNRSRVDVLTGIFGAMKRAVPRSRMRGTAAGTLAAAQCDAERRRDQTGGP